MARSVVSSNARHKSINPSAIPRSLSVIDMLKLGKLIKRKDDTSIEKINLEKFNITDKNWENLGEFSFQVEKKFFSEGGFREAYKAKSSHPDFKGTWVLKKYKQESLDAIEGVGDTMEAQCRKSVQMNSLARLLVTLFNKAVTTCVNFGGTFDYNPVYFGKRYDESVSIEEFIVGDFEKFVNNNGYLCGEDSELRRKAETFVHFTWEKSAENLMVVDIQGVGYNLCDPEVASKEVATNTEQAEFYFCVGNLSQEAIETFKSEHVCNDFCQYLGLKKFS